MENNIPRRGFPSMTVSIVYPTGMFSVTLAWNVFFPWRDWDWCHGKSCLPAIKEPEFRYMRPNIWFNYTSFINITYILLALKPIIAKSHYYASPQWHKITIAYLRLELDHKLLVTPNWLLNTCTSLIKTPWLEKHLYFTIIAKVTLCMKMNMHRGKHMRLELWWDFRTLT